MIVKVVRVTFTSRSIAPPEEAKVSTGVYKCGVPRRWYIRAQRWGLDHEKTPRRCYGDQRWILDDCTETEAIEWRLALLDRMATRTDFELISELETVTAKRYEAGIVVFGDLEPDPDSGALRCPGCGAKKWEIHTRSLAGAARRCPRDARPLRPSWDSFFMDIATATATRATCDRKHVGCVLVRDKRMIAAGYNGSIAGLDHCDDVGHDMHETHCVRTVHAEANAIADAARRGAALEGVTAYVTALPCWSCFKLLAQAGVLTVVYGEAYRAEDELAKRTFEAAKRLGIGIYRFEP